MSGEILPLADEHRNKGLSGGSVLSVYILFVDGYFEEDGGVNQNVKGVSKCLSAARTQKP
jgi:hypothetical protein